MLKDLCRAGIGCMSDMPGSKTDMYKDVVASILALVLSLMIIAFVGKY